jgi:hypothetical protein
MGQNDDGQPGDAVARVPVRSAEYDTGSDPLYAVTDLLANELGLSPLELSPPLGRVVDWDAVVSLLGTPSGSSAVEFVRFGYGDYEVEINVSGSVTLFRGET